MSALAGILIGVAAKVGAPIVKRLLEEHVGGPGAEIAGTVIDAIAGNAGVPAKELPSLDEVDLEEAVLRAERQAPEIILAHVEAQKEANRLQLAEMDKGGTWTWSWRPFWMWLLAFLWTYAIVLRPVANAIAGATIETVDFGMLMALTGAYLGLYMGGHTIKDVAGKWREGDRG